MKNLLLLVALGALGYYAYRGWMSESQATLLAVAAADAPPAAVDFNVKTRVRKMFEEWKRRQLMSSQPHGARLSNMSRELDELRKYLFANAVHSEKGLHALLSHALRELGVSKEESEQVARGFIAEARKDAARGDRKLPSNAQVPAAGLRRFGGGD
jgi:hypothetical protein